MTGKKILAMRNNTNSEYNKRNLHIFANKAETQIQQKQEILNILTIFCPN